MSTQNQTTTSKSLQRQTKILQSSKKAVRSMIANSLGGETATLGSCIYWSLSEMQISYLDFVKLLSDAGMDTALAPTVRAKSALHKALKAETKFEIQERSKANDKFHRKVLDDKDVAVFAIVTSSVDATAQDVTFDTEVKIVMNKKDYSIRVVGGSEDISNRIQERYKEYMGVYTLDQIRSTLLRFIYRHASAIMVRESGGIYFVPATHMEEFKKLQTFFGLLADLNPGKSCEVNEIPVVDAPGQKALMWKTFTADIMNRLNTMRREVSEIEDPTEKSVERRIQDFQKLREEIEVYEALLEGMASDLKDNLNSIQKDLQAKLLA